MPCTACGGGGRYRIGAGPCSFRSLAACERAQRAYYASAAKVEPAASMVHVNQALGARSERRRRPRLRRVSKAVGDAARAAWAQHALLLDEVADEDRDEVLAALASFQATAEPGAIRDALAHGAPSAVEAAFDWPLLATSIEQAVFPAALAMFARGVAIERGRMPGAPAPGAVLVSPDRAADLLAEALRRRVPGLISGSQRAVLQAARRALVSGARVDVDLVVQQIIESVGLTPRAEQAVANFRGAVAEQPLGPGVAEARVRAFVRRKLEQRARAIVETELVGARESAAREAWMEARRTLPGAAVIVETWVTAGPAAVPPVEPRCWALEGVTVRSGELFSGAVAGGAPVVALSPPLHPHCRCHIVRSVGPV